MQSKFSPPFILAAVWEIFVQMVLDQIVWVFGPFGQTQHWGKDEIRYTDGQYSKEKIDM